uniref:NADH-ubiquinone oxidoreductase chain 5 n=1 Tax=Zhangixalus schlegelii TaxID=210202 RepID=Q4W6H5_ZHASC|nr:NADH dehydrogenase subunit 5 [Zhangixalus schlegelii]BAD99477.1 NADH dehydrogenase subunit 5 [Zhangixalus schlegelii]
MHFSLMAPAMMIFLTLLAPTVWLKHKKFPLMTKTAVKLSFYMSLILLTLNCSSHSWATNLSHSWITLNTSLIPIMIQFDLYSLTFMTVAFFVSWSIIEFSIWYMNSDPNLNTFIKYLLIFLMAMIILVSASNLLTLFIGWEGVGIMSYLLIGWFHGRNQAAIAAIQAVLYNRIGDIGFLLAFCWALKELMATNLDLIMNFPTPTPILIALITAAASKSAQFGLHPWLAAAMEGPTPVSALLHSSTMVVAGIFLMIRVSPILMQNQIAMTTCLCLGAMSTFYASASALTQNDIKKIIAHSTSSQLGLMMVAIGIGQPHFAFFHICTHAFFKAMLFLCSGLFIHSLNDEQDIRKMGGMQHLLPMTTTSFSIGSFALMGTPFLSAFYSKDAIIESMSTSHVNLTALLLTIAATAFTAVYSIRLIFFVSLKHVRNTNPLIMFNEQNSIMAVKPIMRLAYGSVFAGLLIFHTLIPNNPVTHTMPTSTKMIALMTTITAFIFAYDLAKKTWTSPPHSPTNPKLSDPLIYNLIAHRWWAQNLLNTAGQTILFTIESFILKNKAVGLINLQKLPLRKIQLSQSGMIKAYLATLFITLALALLLTPE